MKTFKMPDNFLYGAATASLQIEGGDKNNSWYRFCQTGKIKDKSSSETACDHWNRIDEDISLMKDIKLQIYRMSIEWSRIEPQKGVFSKEAMNKYRYELEELQKAGIKPMVTLHHFSNPLWFEDMGGWANESSVDIFNRFTEFVVRSIGDIVSNWVTINEPNIYLIMGYIAGYWPPEQKFNFKLYKKAAINMIRAHIKSYKTIHRERTNCGFDDTMAGAAFHLRQLDPGSNSFLDRLATKTYDNFFHNIYLKGFINGELVSPLGKGAIYGKGIYSDFIGVNYYSRDIIRFTPNPFTKFVKIEKQINSEYNDLGWEIYPQGLYNIISDCYNRFKLPIHITENGISDSTDIQRSDFIYSHLQKVSEACHSGVPVLSYCHWTLMDNFEWREGYTARFGLIEVNFENQARKIRKSGMFYSEIIKNNGVTEDLIKKYLKETVDVKNS